MNTFFTIPIRKISVVCLIAAMLAAPFPGQAQNISLTRKKIRLSSLFTELNRLSGFDFVYDYALVQNAGTVDVSAQEQTIQEILNSVLADKELSYTITGKIVTVTPRLEEGRRASVQQREIRGQVLDQRGQGLEGVSIRVKSKKTTTQTGGEGDFRIPAIPGDVLEFRILGFQTKEHTVSLRDSSWVRVVLADEMKVIEDVIVTGYNYIDRQSFTGSAITITREDLLKVSPGNVLSSLQLFDPSFKMMDNNELGSDPNNINPVYIRGQSGIGDVSLPDEDLLSETQLRNDPNLPTFILDGYEVPVQRVFDLDPTRVESITILKDAASTAIYGSRAANGVVVIETIKPVEGNLRIHYSLNGSVSVPDLSGYHLLNAREKLELELMGGVFDPRPNEMPNLALIREQSYYDKLAEINRGVETDWLSQPLQTALNQRHNILLEGGSSEFIFGTDLHFARTDGVMQGSARHHNGLGFSLTYRKDRLLMRNYIQWNNTVAHESPFGSFSTYAAKNPYDAFRDEDGSYRKTLTAWPGHAGTNGNPLFDAHLRSYNRNRQHEFVNNLNVRWTILDNLRLDSRFAMAKRVGQLQHFTDPAASAFDRVDIRQKGTKRILDDQYDSWDFNAMLLFGRAYNKHHLNLTAGANAAQKDQSRSGYTVLGFLTGNTDDINFAADILGKPTGANEKSRLMGVLASANYTYDNLYLLDFSGRYDGASQFGTNVRFAPFWSIGAGINLHRYALVQERMPWVNNFKIRSNYGQVGKAGFSQSMSKSTYRYTFEQWYASGIGATMISLANPDLEWEKTQLFDAGFDLRLFDRWNLTANYYHKLTVDLIGDITLPLSTGFTSYKSNLGEILNEGVEVHTQYQVLSGRTVSFNLYGTLGHNRNRFLKIDNALEEYNRRVEDYYRTHSVVNKPLNKYYEGASQTAIYAMHSLGINPADGKEVFLKRDGTPTYQWSQLEHVIVGDSEPDIRGSFGFNLSVRDFFVYAGFIYELGGEMYNSTLVSKVENANIYQNVDRRVFDDRWQNPGDRTYLKDIRDWNTVTRISSRFVQRNNYVNFNSITLGYTLPRRLAQSWRMSLMRVQLTANDLGRISTIDVERGTTYPYARTVNMTLSASF